MKKVLIIGIFILLSLNIVFADENLDEAKKIIDSKVSCDELSEEQLELIGDYYMEQMHPGEAHELMDNMMGGEGSASLKQMHINMAKRIYCGEDIYVGYGMMSGFNMMPMMGMMYGRNYYGMGNYYSLNNFLLTLLLIGLIILIIIGIIKLLKNNKRKR